jgi:multidrug resistance efflux pump
LNRYGSLGHTDEADARLERLERAVTATRAELATVQEQIGRLSADPAIRALPAGRLTREHDLWRCGYDTARESEHQEARLRGDDARAHCSRHTAEHIAEHLGPDRDLGPGIGR